jgi:hypothetical protein
MGQSGEGAPRDPETRGTSWVEKNLGRGWVEVEPGVYRYAPTEVQSETGLRLAAPTRDESASAQPG